MSLLCTKETFDYDFIARSNSYTKKCTFVTHSPL